MLCKIATVVGAVAGWGIATGVAALAMTGRIPHEVASPLMLLTLSAALISSACLALQRHQRPLGAAYELGYDTGRRDAIREASGRRRTNVTPIRRDAEGGSEFDRSARA